VGAIDVLLIALYLTAGLVASWDARRKGYPDWPFLIVAMLLGPIALLGMWLLKPRHLPVGTPVRPAAPIMLTDGRKIAPSHVSVVRAVNIIDDTMVCQITAADQTLHWVAQEALKPVPVRGRG